MDNGLHKAHELSHNHIKFLREAGPVSFLRSFDGKRGRVLASFFMTAGFLAAGGTPVRGENGEPSAVAPNAGTILNELEPNRRIVPKQEMPVISDRVDLGNAGESTIHAHIKDVRFVCQEMDISPIGQEALKGRLDRDMNFRDMQDLAVAVTKALRDKGYMTAIAYVPAQEIEEDGVLTIKAIIGRYGDVKVDNTSALSDKRLLGFLYPIRPGRFIESNKLDKSLLIINEIPGMKIKAAMEPGRVPGTAELDLSATDMERQGGYVYTDNYGSRSTGRYRAGIDYHYNNLTHVGDQIDASWLLSDENLRNYALRYQIPLGRDGAVAHASISHMTYDLGYKFKDMAAIGQSNNLEIGLSVPMKRTVSHSSFYDLTYIHRNMTDEMYHIGALTSKKSSDNGIIGIHGYARNDKDAFSYSVAEAFGNVGYDTSYAYINGQLADTLGWYSKNTLSFYYIHQMGSRWELHVSGAGQLAHRNLDSSEEFYISGADGVRAFPQGEPGGDSGILGTLEFRYHTSVPRPHGGSLSRWRYPLVLRKAGQSGGKQHGKPPLPGRRRPRPHLQQVPGLVCKAGLGYAYRHPLQRCPGKECAQPGLVPDREAVLKGPSARWLRGNAFGEVAQGERPAAEGKVAAHKLCSAAGYISVITGRPHHA